MLRLHDFARSGHAHRVRLMLSLLDLPYERLPVDMASGAHKAPDYLGRNPNGTVPTLEDGDLVIPDSTAAIVYLARRYDPENRWLPVEAAPLAEVQRWLSVANNDLVRGPMVARWIRVYRGKADPEEAAARAYRLFAMLEGHLTGREWLALDHPTLADVAMYSYLRVADEGGLDLTPYPAISAWLARVEGLPGFVEMPR